MDFDSFFNALLRSVDGNPNKIVGTYFGGQRITLGNMDDEHVVNSRYYHKHLAEVAKVAPNQFVYEDHKNNQLLMEEVISWRKAEGSWTIQDSDFRMA